MTSATPSSPSDASGLSVASFLPGEPSERLSLAWLLLGRSTDGDDFPVIRLALGRDRTPPRPVQGTCVCGRALRGKESACA